VIDTYEYTDICCSCKRLIQMWEEVSSLGDKRICSTCKPIERSKKQKQRIEKAIKIAVKAANEIKYNTSTKKNK
jgi:hypothetical protein